MLVHKSAIVENITEANIRKEVEKKYLEYALSTIISRALPDVRDGLKPVHRRILYAMHMLRLMPNTPHKKSARIVGEVIGKYHPHGDVAVYEAMVRQAQEFSTRYPLVDGQGNFGNIDGDTAAAMRYTESRLTSATSYLLDGLSEDAVDFRPNYDESEKEPVVLPGNFPNLLANGQMGIAVGMATNIPPHNVVELCDAAVHLIKNQKCSTEDLLQYVKGPDFPTGCDIVEDFEAIKSVYETGRGSLRQRAKWEKEDGRGGSWAIVIREIPYAVKKSELIEKIAELMADKKLPLLNDIRDESDENIRIFIEPKHRGVDPVMLMESLYRTTDLEKRFNYNMNVITADLRPSVLGLKDLLLGWLNHRFEVYQRRAKYRLNAIERRLEILKGFLIVFAHVDEIVKIIRDSEDPKEELIKRFSLNDIQCEAILNMRLRSLRRLDENDIRKEHSDLTKEHEKLTDILSSDAKIWNEIKRETLAMRKEFEQDEIYGPRRTTISGAVAPVAIENISEALMEKEPLTLVLTEKGWIKALRGHGANLDEMKLKDGDTVKSTENCYSTDRITMLANNGRIYGFPVSDIPKGRADQGSIRLMFHLDSEEHPIDVFVPDVNAKYLFVMEDGRGFKISGSELALTTMRKGGKPIARGAFQFMQKIEKTHLACISTAKKMVVIPMEQVSEVASSSAGFVMQGFRNGKDKPIKIEQVNLDDSIVSPETGFAVGGLKAWEGNRGTVGCVLPKKFWSRS